MLYANVYCLCSAVDAIIYVKNLHRFFSAISAKVPVQIFAVNNFCSTAVFELFCGIFRYLATVPGPTPRARPV
jgi:hypothetical protein